MKIVSVKKRGESYLSFDRTEHMVKTFLYHKRCFLYDSNMNYLLEISKNHLLHINQSSFRNDYFDQEISEVPPGAQKDLVMLKKRGFFKESPIKEIINPHNDYIESLLTNSVSDLTLQVTQECNFDCLYCLYSGNETVERVHNCIEMNEQIARDSVDFLYNHSSDSPSVSIAFYGGEPLLNIPLIKYIVNYAESRFFSKNIMYYMTTNGSLLYGDTLRFAVNHGFKIAISLDGPEIIQNYHRRYKNTLKGTFNAVNKNLKQIKEDYPEFYSANVSFLPVVIDDEDYNFVKAFFRSEGISDEKIFPIKANLNGIDYNLSLNRINNSTLKRTDRDTGGINDKPFEVLRNVYLDKRCIPSRWHHNGQCIPGVQRLFVDCFGSFYPCEKIIENPAFKIGDLQNGFNVEKIKMFANIGKYSEEQCKNCWAIRFCEMCISQCLDIDKGEITKEEKLKACSAQKEKALWTLKKIIDGVN